MKYNPKIHHRRSLRLKGYDYSRNGAYFVTICAYNKSCLFGKIIDNEVKLNDAGKMIEEQWNNLALRFISIQLDEHIVMPNHFHGIIMVGAPLVGALESPMEIAPSKSAYSLSKIIGAFKSISTCKYIDGVKTRGWRPFDKKKLWQQNYYEHIIRNEASLDKIRNYIVANPSNWLEDELWVS